VQLPRPLDSVRWDPKAGRGHVESFFLKANDPRDPRRALWVKHTLLVPDDGSAPLAELWAIAFPAAGAPIAAKSSHDAGGATLNRGSLGFAVGGAELRSGLARGAAGDGEGRIAWNLTWDPSGQRPMFGFPHPWMYAGSWPKSKTYTSSPSIALSGTFTLPGGTWDLDGWRGMLGHNWGVAHTPSYRWGQCALLRELRFDGSPGDPVDAVWEGYSGRIRVGPWLTPWLTGANLRLDGRDLAFNDLPGLLSGHVEITPFGWSFARRSGDQRLRVEVQAPREAFAGLRYLDPDGRENHCLNAKVATCRVHLDRWADRWVPECSLVGEHSCAFEILTQDSGHSVTIQV
jgi:hypothetical protein